MSIYLDCNATTPIEPEVVEKINNYLTKDFGNEGSHTHEYGSVAKKEDVVALYGPVFETTKFNIVPGAWFSIRVNDLDHDWVMLWTKEDLITSSDTTSLFAQESFQIKDGKIIGINQFQRPIN